VLGVECVHSPADYGVCDTDVNKALRYKTLGGNANAKAEAAGCKAQGT